MKLDLDRIARLVLVVALGVGGAGIGWGFWESHEAAARSQAAVTEQHKVSRLLTEHSHDLKVQQEESRALDGAVLYVEEAIAELCAKTAAKCPPLPGAVP